MKAPEPYFMKNDEWYYYDETEHCLKLTEKAPEKARKSYEKFYRESVFSGASIPQKRPE